MLSNAMKKEDSGMEDKISGHSLQDFNNVLVFEICNSLLL